MTSSTLYDIICLASQELGYDSVTPDSSPERRLVIERFVCYWLLPAIFDRRRGRSGSILVVVKDQVDALTKREKRQCMLGK